MAEDLAFARYDEAIDPAALLADATLVESGRAAIAKRGVCVRQFPFPYVAALAVAQQSELMTRDAFEDFHAFVNGAGPTPYGDGLGLEIGDSVCFVEDGAVCGDARLAELAPLGWLDTLEGAGRVEDSLRRLEALGLVPSLYLDRPRSGGDGASDRAALCAFGVRYFTNPAWCETAKFGDHLDYRRPELLAAELASYGWQRWIASADTAPRRALTPTQPILSHQRTALRRELLGLFNRMVSEIALPDGTHITMVKQFRGELSPSAASFAAQVTSTRLDALAKGRGAVIVRQRFGLWSLIGRSRATAGHRASTPPVLDPHAVLCWREIAARKAAGELLVATAGRLIGLIALRDALVLKTAAGKERWVVTIEGVRDGTTLRPPSDGELNGLSLLVPNSAPEVVVSVAGRSAALPLDRTVDSANPGLDALHRPWEALEWPVP